jgi:hypothetical protein
MTTRRLHTCPSCGKTATAPASNKAPAGWVEATFTVAGTGRSLVMCACDGICTAEAVKKVELAEPQGEPEFVWRVHMTFKRGGQPRDFLVTSASGAESWRKPTHPSDAVVTIERAQIGPWEDVESS